MSMLFFTGIQAYFRGKKGRYEQKFHQKTLCVRFSFSITVIDYQFSYRFDKQRALTGLWQIEDFIMKNRISDLSNAASSETEKDFVSPTAENEKKVPEASKEDNVSRTDENIQKETDVSEADVQNQENIEEQDKNDDNSSTLFSSPTSNGNFKKKSNLLGLTSLMVLPFLLFSIGVVLLSVFFFKEYIQASGIWRFAINTNAVVVTPDDENTNGEVIGTSMDDFSISTVLPPDGSTENSSDTSNDDTDEPKPEQIYYDKKDFPGYRWGDLWAKLSIPAIGLEEKNVYVGESNSIYRKGIGKRFGTRFPGQGGNIVLGAHVTREFYDLSELKIGDKVYIKTGYGDYVYEVYETFIFSISDYHHVLNYDEGEKLTMYTCHPRGTAYRTERFGVLCKKISGPEWIKID